MKAARIFPFRVSGAQPPKAREMNSRRCGKRKRDRPGGNDGERRDKHWLPMEWLCIGPELAERGATLLRPNAKTHIRGKTGGGLATMDMRPELLMRRRPRAKRLLSSRARWQFLSPPRPR